MGDCPSTRLCLSSSYKRRARVPLSNWAQVFWVPARLKRIEQCAELIDRYLGVDGPRCSAAPQTASRSEALIMVNAAPTPLFTIERLGVVMAPEPGNPLEVEGVLNPAGVVGPDGHYYLFPRLVAAGNYSRIGVARVRRDVGDRPIGVERLGVALEPETPYEIIRPGVGGCEDPRITYVPCAEVYVMAYTALGL